MVDHFVIAYLISILIAESSNRACLDIDDGGWQLVRYVPSGNTFHPATDDLFGKDVYGDPNDMSAAWSVAYDNIDFDQFLFAVGDCDKWLIAEADVVLDDYWEGAQRRIYKSSLHDYTYTAEWLKRKNCCKEDPWISLYDHGLAKPNKDVLYGEKSYIFKFGEDPYHNGASVYIRKWESKCLGIDNGGWQLVRYVPTGNAFHPATDKLYGKDAYGDPRDMSKAWSVAYDTINFNQFLFSFGDCEKWLIAEADVVLDDNWGYAQRKIHKSSLYSYSYTAGWYKRPGAYEDPWISLYDHSLAKPNKDVLYGENSFVFKFGNDPYHNGASVYIRKAKRNGFGMLKSNFLRSDEDNDGCLSFEEAAFDIADTNKDRELTSSEYALAIANGFLAKTSVGENRMTDYNRIDKDHDDVLTYKEILFDVADSDKDGKISVDELYGAR